MFEPTEEEKKVEIEKKIEKQRKIQSILRQKQSNPPGLENVI